MVSGISVHIKCCIRLVVKNFKKVAEGIMVDIFGTAPYKVNHTVSRIGSGTVSRKEKIEITGPVRNIVNQQSDNSRISLVKDIRYKIKKTVATEKITVGLV